MANVFALIASLMWGGSYFVGGRVTTRVSAFAVTAVSSAVTAAFFLVVGLAQGRMTFDHIDVATGVIAGITTLLGNALLFMALTKGPMGVIGGLQVLLVLIPLAWSVSAGDPLSAAALIGVIVVLCGVVLLGVPEMKGSTSRTAVILALIAAASFGIQQTAIAEGSQDDAYVTLFLAQLIVVILLGAVGLARRTTGGLDRSALLPLVFVGLANAIAFSAFAEGTRIGDPGLVSALASLDPVVMALLAYFVLKQRMAKIQVVALGVVMVGGTLIALN